MATFAIDPATANVADFTSRVSGLEASIVDDGGVPAIKIERLAGASGFLSYDPAGTAADVQIVTRNRHSSTATNGNYALSVARLEGGSFDLYAGGVRGTQSNTLISYLNGTVAGLDSADIGISSTTYAWQRFEVTGSTIRVRRWTGTPADEPATWDSEVTDTDITAAGYVGIGARNMNSGDSSYYAWIGIGTNGDVAPTSDGPQAIRKGSTFDIETTLGTITTATLNSVDVFDHVSGQVGTTVSFAGAATDEITTSGEYTLALGDGTGTETITVQVNVVGLPIYNLNKDGADLTSLADVEVIVMTGAAGSRVINQNTALEVTDVSGNTVAYEVTDTSLTVDQNVFVVIHSAAGAVGIPFTETLELI